MILDSGAHISLHCSHQRASPLSQERGWDCERSRCSLSHSKGFPVAVILVITSRWQPKIEREGWYVHPVLGKGVVLNRLVPWDLPMGSGLTTTIMRHVTTARP